MQSPVHKPKTAPRSNVAPTLSLEVKAEISLFHFYTKFTQNRNDLLQEMLSNDI